MLHVGLHGLAELVCAPPGPSGKSCLCPVEGRGLGRRVGWSLPEALSFGRQPAWTLARWPLSYLPVALLFWSRAWYGVWDSPSLAGWESWGLGERGLE